MFLFHSEQSRTNVSPYTDRGIADRLARRAYLGNSAAIRPKLIADLQGMDYSKVTGKINPQIETHALLSYSAR